MELLTRRKHGQISDDQWALVCGLQTHVDDFKRNGSYESIELMSMGASQFSLTQKIFDKDFVAAMYARVCSFRSSCSTLLRSTGTYKLVNAHYSYT